MCSSMAETETETESYPKHQKLASEQQNHANSSKYYNHFLYKVALVVVFFVILPLFPSQAPEFFNQTVVTRSWELLHLLLVGIAVSYGLFSRRNDKTEKENNNAKFDNAHSYVSRFLQVSSVFDDEAEISPGSDENNKVQTWSSQYYRNEPVVVVAQEHSALDEQRGTSSRIGEKPLLLPVRSLKQRVPDLDNTESVNESRVNSGSLSRSNSRSGSRRFPSKGNKGRGVDGFGGLDHEELEEKLKESVVLPSPIPWRSRSGRMMMDVKEEVDNSPTMCNLPTPIPPPMEESEFNRLDPRASRPPSSRSSRSNSMSSSPKLSPSPSLSSPKKVSPSPSLAGESQALAKSAEDSGRKKSFNKSCPPPPPPPPPMFFKASSMRPSNGGVSYEKDFTRSFNSEAMEMKRVNGEYLVSRVNSGGAESKHRSNVDGLSMGMSVRTTRAGENVGGANWVNGKVEKSSKDVEATLVEKTSRKKVGFDETSFCIPNMPTSAFGEFPGDQEKEDLFDNVVSDSDEETESEDDDNNIGGGFIQKDIVESPKPSPRHYEPAASSGSVSDGGPDVDKKADEFIAKFREQIRLQRIDSIKRSSAQISRNMSR